MLADITALDPRTIAVLSDFDGSLAPIVERPEDAVPVPGARQVLGRLLVDAGLVGIVSGRPVDFLRTRLDVDGLVLVGQYGLERLEGSVVVADPRIADYAAAIAAARAEAESSWPELYVEHKGDTAFTVHWRSRPDRDVGGAVRALARRHGLRSHGGRMACEVRPPVDLDKGSAVRELVDGYRGAVFVGDDRGDLSAFAALDDVPVTLRVGVRSPEAPHELDRAVDVMVDGPEGAVALLSELADEISAHRSR